MIERVGEFLGVRPVAVSEPWVIWRDQVVAIGKTNEERLEHSRRRGNSMQKENRRRVLRPGFPVENRQPVDLNCAIESRMVHRRSLSLCLCQHLTRCGGHECDA